MTGNPEPVPEEIPVTCDNACSTAPLGEDLRCTLTTGHTAPKHAVIADGRLLAQWLDARLPDGSCVHAAFSRGRITRGR